MYADEGWNAKSFGFVLAHRRVPTAQEWKWMRYQYELVNCTCVKSYASIAADGDAVNSRLVADACGTRADSFRTDDADYQVTVTVRAGQNNQQVVHLKMTTGDRIPVQKGKIVFPGVGREVALDANGRATLPYCDYRDYLRKALSFQCVDAKGVWYNLELE